MVEIIRPKVGLAGIILRDNKVLLGLRKGSHASGTWAFPGGHFEMYEDFKTSLLREIEEETNLGKDNMGFIDDYPPIVTNDIFKEYNKHYVTLYMRLFYKSGSVELMEPNKCEEWKWFQWNNLPSPLMEGIDNLVKRNYNPFVR